MPEKWLFLLSENSHCLQYFLIVFNKTIIPLALVGYTIRYENLYLSTVQNSSALKMPKTNIIKIFK